MATIETAKLTIRRGGGFADIFRAYTIDINGEEVARIKRKSELTIEVPAGQVLIEARIDWCRAEPLEISLAPGEATRVEVSNTYGALRAAYAISKGADSYLTLTRL